MADYNAFGSVDDEGTVLGHKGEVTHEDLLLFHFARLFVYQPHTHTKGSGVSYIPVLALFHIILGFPEIVIQEFQDQIACEILDGGHVIEHLP